MKTLKILKTLKTLKKTRIATLIFLITAQTAAASPVGLPVVAALGTDAVQGTPDAVCRIQVGLRGKKPALCTGTLITPTQVMTAAHCFESGWERIQVDCGYVGAGRSVAPEIIKTASGHRAIYRDGLLFKERHSATRVSFAAGYDPEASISPSDAAIVHLDRRSRITPIPVAGSADWPASNCRMAGFGLGAHGTTSGLPYHSDVPSEIDAHQPAVLQLIYQRRVETAALGKHLKDLMARSRVTWLSGVTDADVVSALHATGEFSVLMGPGDSGGPLYCWSPAQATWRLVGVNQGYQIGLNRPEDDDWTIRFGLTWTSLLAARQWVEVNPRALLEKTETNTETY